MQGDIFAELIRLLIVGCTNGCAKFLDLWELEHAVVHINSEHPKHAQWGTCLVSMQAMEELGHFQLLGIVYTFLQHGAVHYNAET
jgi:hypothetical protein